MPLTPADRATLEAELAAVNLELRELKSTDFALRAYVETWLGFVGGSVGTKMIFDWQKAHAKPPLVAFPLLLLALGLFLDALSQRQKKKALEAVESARMKRQRELRELLGVDDAPVPALVETALA